jgi:hypothetical protein
VLRVTVITVTDASLLHPYKGKIGAQRKIRAPRVAEGATEAQSLFIRLYDPCAKNITVGEERGARSEERGESRR